MQNRFRMLCVLILAGLVTTAPAANANSDAQRAPAAARTRADKLIAADKPEEALAIYKSLVAAHPDNPAYLTGLGHAQLKDHQALAASRTLREVIDKHPDHEPAYPLLQEAYYASGQSEQAFGILQQARERFGRRRWMQDY